MDLTDKQWAVVESLLPKDPVRDDGRGRPWREPREVFNGILWILRTGAPWNDMPSRYPSGSTCYRRFKTWSRDGTIKRLMQDLADDLVARGKLDLTETYIDGTHAGAKRGVRLWEELVAVLPPRSWQSQTAMVFLYLPPSLRVNVTKYGSLKPSSKSASRLKDRNELLETELMTALGFRKRFTSKESS